PEEFSGELVQPPINPEDAALRGGHIPFTKDAKKVLELSLREALARKDKSIESGHVLLGILRAPNPTTERLLGGSGPIDELRSKVHTLLDRAA
ncbi:Clp protease N-terminal domain-containing protein, partial [Nocardia brasiliensis]|uniref:Clp protease N-terminal domain-containing protein n=1 Tax=Nocardia brasiliensis TaxID=37326 RepID=UPI0032AF61FB